MVQGRPKDEDITRIWVSFEAIVEGDTRILVTPSFKSLSKHTTIIKTNLNYNFSNFLILYHYKCKINIGLFIYFYIK